MVKVQINSQGKPYVTGGKALLAPTLTTKSITQNGTYNASSDNADGYSSVTVNVSGSGSVDGYRIVKATNWTVVDSTIDVYDTMESPNLVQTNTVTGIYLIYNENLDTSHDGNGLVRAFFQGTSTNENNYHGVAFDFRSLIAPYANDYIVDDLGSGSYCLMGLESFVYSDMNKYVIFENIYFNL